MDFLTAAVMITGIIAATVAFAIKHMSSTPARIAAVIGAIAVLIGVLPPLFDALQQPAAPNTTPSPTVTIAPAPSSSPASTLAEGASPSPASPAAEAPAAPEGGTR